MAAFFLSLATVLCAQDFSVTSPGFFFNINGQEPNPTITVVRGRTYTFAVNTESFHPFEITDTSFSPYNDGVDNNNISSGTITFTVPMTAPNTLAYICSFHFFSGAIKVVDSTPAADFTVTTPDFFFAINGQQPNPTLTLTRGSNYIFAVNDDPSHPFEIVSNLDGTPYTSGVSNNNISSGRIAFHVPTNAPSTLYYICSVHFFGGTIQIVDPPPPPDFTVTTPDFYYSFNGQGENPTITLMRGQTYTFAVDADPSHPFEIVSDPAGTGWDEGVMNNNISSGLLIFTVPADAPDKLYYICSIHFFGGEINIIDPPTPPIMVQLLSIDVGASNVVMTSLGTNGNGWLAIPEFSSNLVVSNWTVVPGFTNSFHNGTNVTTFNRLDPMCGPNVFLRMKNVKN